MRHFHQRMTLSMGRRHLRLSLSTLLLIVAALGILLGVHRRWARFRELAQGHEPLALQYQLRAQDSTLRLRLANPDAEARLRASEEARRKDLRAKANDHARMARFYESRW